MCIPTVWKSVRLNKETCDTGVSVSMISRSDDDLLDFFSCLFTLQTVIYLPKRIKQCCVLQSLNKPNIDLPCREDGPGNSKRSPERTGCSLTPNASPNNIFGARSKKNVLSTLEAPIEDSVSPFAPAVIDRAYVVVRRLRA